jgi:chemotaxis protein CheX
MHSDLRAEFIVEELCAATANVFSTMLNLHVRPEAAFIQRSSPEAQDGVEGLVGLAGNYAGIGALLCTAELACFLSSCFLQMPITCVDEMVLDTLGELTNMVIGSFKNTLEKSTGPLSMSIPTVVYGKSITTRAMKHDQWIVVPFWINGQQLIVKACLSAGVEAGLGPCSKHDRQANSDLKV